MIIRNLSKKDILNANLGMSLKDACDVGTEGILNGYAVLNKTSVDEETGETSEHEIAVLKINGELYSGESKVTVNRIKELDEVFSEDEDGEELEIKLVPVKCGRGMAVSLMIL